MSADSPSTSSSSPPPTFPSSFSPISPSSPHRPLSQAAVRSRSPPLTPLPALSTTVPGLTPFDRAVHVVNTSNRAIDDTHVLLTSSTGSSSSNSDSDAVVFTPEEQLLLYGAYKQATKGDIKGIKPPFFEIASRSKWQAWANMRGKTTTEAQDTYVDLVVNSLTKPGSHPDHVLLSEEITQIPSRSSSPIFSTVNMDKDLPPIHAKEEVTAPQPPTPPSPSLRPRSTRQASISNTIQSTVIGGLRSAATSVYELASENIVDSETEDSEDHNTSEKSRADQGYHEITETVVEEEILDDAAYEAEVRKSFSSSGQDFRIAERTELIRGLETNREQDKVEDHKVEADEDEDEDDNDELYQSSEEYDESEIEERSNIKEQPSTHSPVVVSVPSPVQPRRQDINVKEFVDEGVFEDEDEQDDLHDDEVHAIIFGGESKEITNRGLPFSPVSKGSALARDTDSHLKEAVLASPPIEPYRVSALDAASVSSLTLPFSASDTDVLDHATASHPVSTPTSLHASTEELLCPVSKKNAASGQMCPAAMFAQAKTVQAGATSGPTHGTPSPLPLISSSSTSVELSTKESEEVSENDDAEPRSTNYPRSPTEPSPVSTPTSARSAAVNAATSQGKRIGQGIVSRFSALRSSLAAASARAASSALSSGPNSGSTIKNPNAVVVKDPVTNQSVTVICPHLVSTQLLETEVVRLQTDISVLHERLDLLQESLKIKSQTQALERRSARGILKLILRQGLINAILLLIVFAVLYKRRSPIAFAILAYVGQGRKEGEAGWRALMRWTANLLRRGQQNQQYVLNAGRRNGYW